jgi:hypothetical protein
MPSWCDEIFIFLIEKISNTGKNTRTLKATITILLHKLIMTLTGNMSSLLFVQVNVGTASKMQVILKIMQHRLFVKADTA